MSKGLGNVERNIIRLLQNGDKKQSVGQIIRQLHGDKIISTSYQSTCRAIRSLAKKNMVVINKTKLWPVYSQEHWPCGDCSIFSWLDGENCPGKNLCKFAWRRGGMTYYKTVTLTEIVLGNLN